MLAQTKQLPLFDDPKQATAWAHQIKYNQGVRRALIRRMKELVDQTLTTEKKAELEHGTITLKAIHESGGLMNLWDCYHQALQVIEWYKKHYPAGAGVRISVERVK